MHLFAAARTQPMSADKCTQTLLTTWQS